MISHSSLFCCRRKHNVHLFPLKLVLQKLYIFTEIVFFFFFFARTLKAPEVFLCFACLLGAEKVFVGLGGWGMMWEIFPIISNIYRARKINIHLYSVIEKKQEHLNFCYKTQWINYDFWGKIECYKGWVIISSAEVIAGWSNSHPHWGPSSTRHLNACLILITYISPAWP